MNLTQRGVTSFSWNFTANLVRIPVGFIQAVVLARLLSVEYFGIYAGAVAFVQLSNVIFEFGTNKAFVHHSPETNDENKALKNLLSLKILSNTIWATIIIIIS